LKKLVKLLVTAFLSLLLLLLVYVNIRLGYQPDMRHTVHGTVNVDVIRQLAFLKHELHHNQAGEKMQQLYPEGFLFIHTLYALVWYDVAGPLQPASPFYREAVRELQWVNERVNSPAARGIFDPEQGIDFGAFYTGWSNLVLGRKLLLQPPAVRDSADVALFQSRCAGIARFIRENETPFATSYAGAAWPADMVVCVASLTMHDRMFEPQYEKTVATWIAKVRQRLDTATGLIPHATNAATGYAVEGARGGSSQSLILCFLPEIDSVFAHEQFARYKELFLDYRLGLPGIREYPKGNTGLGDVDSGPVIWGHWRRSFHCRAAGHGCAW